MQVSPSPTFGHVRKLVIDTIVELRENKIPVGTAMAIAANVKVLNDNVMAEVAAARLALKTHGQAHNFGRVMTMGTALIGSDQVSAE